MSGGDGRDHNSGAHDNGGNINGGPTGIGGGGTNSGDGWHIDKDGSLHIDITEGNQTKPGPGKEGNGNGGDGSNSGSSNSVTVLGNSGYVNMAHAGVPAALYPVSGVLTISLNWSTITAAVREAIIGLDAYLGDILTKVAPYAGRFLGIVIGSLWPSQIAPDPKLTYNFKDLQVDKDNSYSVIALPAELVTTVPVKDIPKNTTVPARVLAQAVIDELAKTRPVTITPVKPTPVPVVRAQKTDKPNVYTAQVVPGMKPMQIYVTAPKRVTPEKSPVMPNRTPAVKQYLSSPDESRSHHAILDFGGDHEPVYISITKQVKPEEEKKLAEQAKKDWAALYPVEAAQEQLDIVNKEFSEADKHYRSKLDVLNKLKNTPEGLTLSDPAKHPLVYEQNADQRKITKQDIAINSRHLVDTLLNEGVKAVWREVMKEELKKPPTVDTAKKAILLSAFYERLSIRLLDVNKKIGPAQKEVNIALESRKKAEGKKKAAEDKVKAEQDKKRQGVKDKGHSYHPEPDVEEIKGLGELKPSKKKTPKQGGAGKRARWIGDKGRKIYEWDSQHGELEGYRASDGEHLGAFDPKTGKQLKPADPKRNIKKYL